MTSGGANAGKEYTKRAHFAPHSVRKAGANTWHGSQAMTHCQRACGPDLKADTSQVLRSGCAIRNATYSPAMYANVMKFSCVHVAHERCTLTSIIALHSFAGFFQLDVISTVTEERILTAKNMAVNQGM